MNVQVHPCWNCGTRHISSEIPRLCSVTCIAAWRKRYQLAYAGPSEILDSPISAHDVRRQERAQLAQIRATTPGAGAVQQQRLAEAQQRDRGPFGGHHADLVVVDEIAWEEDGWIRREPVYGPAPEPYQADEPQPLAACPPRPPEPPLAKQPATGLGPLLVQLAYTIRRWFR